MPPLQFVRSPLADASAVGLAPTAFCRDQFPWNVNPYELPLVELGGLRSTLPNSDPLSLILVGRSDDDGAGSPAVPRILTNCVTESCATPAVRSPTGPAVNSVCLSDDRRPNWYEIL